jgi:hypothetical protein
MPVVFGPGLGPRQGEEGRKFTSPDSHKTITRSVSFLTNRAQLEELLPERFAVRGEPVVTVFASYMTEIEWLAGRGYNVLGVTIPVSFTGKVDRAVGSFLAVLWENLTDPILTGREELGFAKIYCDLPEPRIHRGQLRRQRRQPGSLESSGARSRAEKHNPDRLEPDRVSPCPSCNTD